MYGGRYLRLAAGDPGLFSGLKKVVGKVVGKVAGSVVGKVAGGILGGPLGIVAGTVLPALAKTGAGKAVAAIAGRVARTAVMPFPRGIGSPVTRGALKLPGGGTFTGASRPGIGPITVGAGTAIGAAAVATQLGRKPRTQPQGQPSRASRRSTARGTRKCCPRGTRRMVCFKRGRTKSARARREEGTDYGNGEGRRQAMRGRRRVSAKQRAARARFARAARRGPIRKGARL